MTKRKLTREQIEALRTEYVDFSTSQAELAEKFNVSIGTVNYYLRGLGRFKRAYSQTNNAGMDKLTLEGMQIVQQQRKREISHLKEIIKPGIPIIVNFQKDLRGRPDEFVKHRYHYEGEVTQTTDDVIYFIDRVTNRIQCVDWKAVFAKLVEIKTA